MVVEILINKYIYTCLLLALAIIRLDWRLSIPVPALRSRGLHSASAAGA